MYVYFITPFAGPAIAQAYYKARIWRWAFGSLAIILPAIAAALLLMYIWYAARHPKTVPPPAKEGLDTSLLRSIWLHALDLDGKMHHIAENYGQRELTSMLNSARHLTRLFWPELGASSAFSLDIRPGRLGVSIHNINDCDRCRRHHRLGRL